jgi:GntR family transcriptional regulator, arabinose operon transcriptional repressor
VKESNGGSGWRQIAAQLREAIARGEFARGAKMPSEADLTRRFGVSKLTVHRALRELANEGLVERVERVGTFVAALPVKRNRTVALLLPAAEGFLEIKYLAGIQDALGADNTLVLYATDNDPVLEAEMIVEAAERSDGIIILPTCHVRLTPRLEAIQQRGCPVVCIDRRPTGSCLPAVTSDNFTAMYGALEQLYAAGHRRIAYFGFHDMSMSSVKDRYQAYVDFLRDRSLGDPYEGARFIEPKPYPEHHVAFRLMEDSIAILTSRTEPYTAAVCVNEFYVNILLELFQAMPPEHRPSFEITSFYDWPHVDWPHVASPTVRTHVIRQNAREIGRTAALELMAEMNDPQARTAQTGAGTVEISSSYVEFVDRPGSGGAGASRLARPPHAAS